MNTKAIQAARNLGMDERTISALAKALRPLTPEEKEQNRQFQIELHAAEQKKANLKKAWKMSFAEYAERKANGTLPEMY